MLQTKEINQILSWNPNPNLEDLPLVNESEHRLGMRHFAACVSIVTTNKDGHDSGLTATAITSVTADPPRIIAFVNKGVYAASQVLESGLLCVNTLTGSQKELACIFAGMHKEIQGSERFNYGKWDRLITGAPILVGAKASFDCRVIKVFDESTHYAFLCEVLATESNQEENALLFMGGKFYTMNVCEEHSN